jgi:Cu/Ag efflux protein CusF
MDAQARPKGRWKVWLLFLLLLVGLAVGVWGTLRAVMPEKGVYRVTGVYKDRWGATMILVQHDPVPGLMETMEFMSFFVESKELLDNANLQKGDRIRFVIRQIPDRLLITKIEKVR